MHRTHRTMEPEGCTYSPERNRYFYGKMLDVYHFELETKYHNAKRWLINRAVLGYGVVCGLDVLCGSDPYTIIVTPGIAIDKWGREIIVPHEIEVKIPRHLVDAAGGKEPEKGDQQQQEKQPQEKKCIEIVVCYHECLADPVPVLAGDCHNTDPCAPGTIREKFSIEFSDECEYPHHDECQIPQIVSGGQIDYSALAKWVSRDRNCFDLPRNPCIRLAHIYIEEEGHCGHEENIDISVRPIVYTNDVLFNILLGWRREPRDKYAK